MDKFDVKTVGFYRYALPHWNHLRTVEVVEAFNIYGKPCGFNFLFQSGTHPCSLDEIPSDALFFILDTELEEN